MGNTCKGLIGEEDMEIYTGTGMYRFKKSVSNNTDILILIETSKR